MSEHCKGLQNLLDQDANANQYFCSLPDYVKDQIRTRAQNMDSMETLQAYGNKLLRGDG